LPASANIRRSIAQLRRYRMRVIVTILTMLAIAGFVVLITWPNPLKSALGDDAYKLFLQFSLVTVVGGLVSAVFSELKRESESRQARLQSLLAFHGKALSAYNKAKKLRRLMTVLIPYDVEGTTFIRKKEYRALMAELEDVQLDFESLKRHVAVARELFASTQPIKLKSSQDIKLESNDIEGLLKFMEKYLRRVLKEFEQRRFSDADPESKLSDLGELLAFIDDTDQPEGFVINFSGPYDDLEAALLSLTLR